jgi:rubrerythrin
MNAKAAPPGTELETPRTLEVFMAQAVAMEVEAAQRYEELADAMETHNNVEVAKLFRTMAGVEGKHAQQLMAQMSWTSAPPAPPLAWDEADSEGPETAASDEVHYLMQPWHALQIALHNEQRAERFFARIAAIAEVESVRKAALELQEEEREHVALVEAWLAKVPQPDEDWAVDPDPPRYTD